jgi:ABC-type multidrug transport system ATPase subunit
MSSLGPPLHSVVFMDEPTSGLDARSAATVMRTVRNIGHR